MKNNKLKENFSLTAFLIGLIITILFYFLVRNSVNILAVGLVLSLAFAFVVKYLQNYRNKKKYIEVLEAKSKETFDLILDNTRKMLIDPVDVESVHQLRVSIRRFRAMISLAKSHMDLDRYLLIQDYFRQRGP